VDDASAQGKETDSSTTERLGRLSHGGGEQFDADLRVVRFVGRLGPG
jgi:hypothetical protein